jgi:hypothetical protein
MKYHIKKMYGGMEVYFQAFLTLALHGGGWSTSHSGHFFPGKRTDGTYSTGEWVASSLIWTGWLGEKSLSLPEIWLWSSSL